MKIDINREWTFPELCASFNLSQAWVRKIINYFSLKSWIGQRGKRVHFNYGQFGFLQNVISLRRLGFGLEDIKQMHDIENGFSDIVGSLKPDENEGAETIRYIPIYLTAPWFFPAQEIEYSLKKLKANKEKKEALDKLREAYRYVIHTARLKASHNFKILEEKVKEIENVAKCYQEKE